MKKTLTLIWLAASLMAGTAHSRDWSIETVDSSGHAGQFAAMAIDAMGGLHICYYDSLNRDLKYARRNGTMWSYGVIDSAGDVGRYCSIVMDSGNLLRVSYFDSTNRALKYGVFNGTTWAVEVADPGPGVGQYTSICLNGTTPIISYYDQARQDLKYATKPSAWAPVRVDSAGAVGRHTSVAFGGDNKPRISYYSDTLKQLRFARMLGSNWVLEVPDTAVNAGTYSSLVLNTGNTPFIAYLDSAGGRIKRAVKPVNSWIVDTVDNSGAVGGYCSIALDNIGNPVLSYYDLMHGDLIFADHSGAAWASETIDTAGTVGLYTSCRVARDSSVYIAYYDQTRGRLKLAHGQAPDIIPPVVAAISVSPDTVWQTGFTVLTGRITDNRKVAGAEYFIDIIGAAGTGLAAWPVDSFGSAAVDVFDTVFTAALAAGPHRVFLHGIDDAGLWGAFDSTAFVKTGADAVGPAFAIQFAPNAPYVGAFLAIVVTPSEPLHPDSALACSLATADGAVRAVTLLADSIRYSGVLNTTGYAAGVCRLAVSGYDRWANRGTSSVIFQLAAAGAFLPDELVYVWPNPARGGRVYFHYYVNANADVTAEVFNLEGRRITRLSGRGEGGRPPHQSSSNAIAWDISGVASDVYLLRLCATSDASGERRSVTKKFAIVK